jgi:hypothetical protein
MIGEQLEAWASSDQPGHLNAAYLSLACLTFLWRVTLPCVVYYGQTPTGLYRAAKNGDNQALDQLLRLDKLAVTIPAISRRWREIMTGENMELRKMMQGAVAGQPGRTLPANRVKLMVMSLVQMAGEFCGYRVGTEDVRTLLDAIVQDRTKDGHSFDGSIPDDDPSLAKALQRARERWTDLLGIPSALMS